MSVIHHGNLLLLFFSLSLDECGTLEVYRHAAGLAPYARLEVMVCLDPGPFLFSIFFIYLFFL